MTHQMSPEFCVAFRDATHRFALERSPRGVCACGAVRHDAEHSDGLLMVNENTDLTALPWMLGYDAQDYPMYLWPKDDGPHAHLWVQDGESDPWSGDYRERCTVCPATRWVTLAEAEG